MFVVVDGRVNYHPGARRAWVWFRGTVSEDVPNVRGQTLEVSIDHLPDR